MPDTETDDKTEPKTEPKTEQKTAGKDSASELGDAGLRALRSERTAREKAERDAAETRTELEALRAKHLSAEEKALESARKEGRNEALLETNRRIVRSEIRAAAGAKVSDPEDAAALLGDLDKFIVKNEVDLKAISEAISELVKAKPYLAPNGAKPRPLPGGSATRSTGVTLNDEIRRRIRGG